MGQAEEIRPQKIGWRQCGPPRSEADLELSIGLKEWCIFVQMNPTTRKTRNSFSRPLVGYSTTLTDCVRQVQFGKRRGFIVPSLCKTWTRGRDILGSACVSSSLSGIFHQILIVTHPEVLRRAHLDCRRKATQLWAGSDLPLVLTAGTCARPWWAPAATFESLRIPCFISRLNSTPTPLLLSYLGMK